MLTPLISFSSPLALKQAIQNSVLQYSFDDKLFDHLTARDLPPVTSPTVLALILGVSPKLITAMAKTPDRYYRLFTIPKKSGGERIILAPRIFLKTVQRYILKFILDKQPTPSFATGFIKGKGIVHNARLHAGSRFLLNVDLEDFFGTVKLNRVRQIYLNLGYSIAVADTFAQLCTYKGALPQGAPTSPALSNLVFAEIDNEIVQLAAEHRLTYSRYADDISFSGPNAISRVFLPELNKIIARNGFRLNPRKTRFAGPGQAKYVTGLVVNVRPQKDRKMRRKLRAIFHQAKIKPEGFENRSSELLGWAGYAKSFDFRRGQEYLTVARSLRRRLP